MRRIYPITLIHTATHACFTGSKVIISLLALKLGASQLVIGFLVAAYAVAPLLFGIYAGRLADRIGMRAPMFGGAAAIGAAMLVGFTSQTLEALFATALLVGVGFVFFIVSVQNLVGTLPGNRTRNYSVLTIGYSASNLIGPLVAGYTIEYAGYATAFLVFAFFALIPLGVLLIHTDLTRALRVSTAPQSVNALELMRIPMLRRQILITGLLMSAWELYLFYVPIYGHSLGLSPSTIGSIVAIFASATFLIRFALPIITGRWGVERVLAGAMLIAASGSAVFPMLTQSSMLMAASFVIGLGLGCGQPLSLTTSFERSPPGRSGEVAGLRTIASNCARLVVPVLSGVFGAALGEGAVFWLNAANLSAVSYMARRMDRT